MQLVLPELIAEVRELSDWLIVGGLCAGAFLWLAGWWSHRFWIVLGATVVAGVLGLYEAHSLHLQPALAALLLAVAAGLLGLSLMRLLAFAAGGVACLWLVQALFPLAHAPAVCFLAGGVLSVLLFRLWMMFLTSLTGTLLMAHCGLALAAKVLPFDGARWTQANPALCTAACLTAAAIGCAVQFLLNRKRKPKSDGDSEDDDLPKRRAKTEGGWAWIQTPFRRAA